MYQKLPSFFFITLLMQFMMPAKAQLQTNKKLFSSLPSSYTGITFRNDIQENKISITIRMNTSILVRE